MAIGRRLQKQTFNLFLGVLFLFSFVSAGFSQSWDLHTSAIPSGGATAEISDIDVDHKTLTLKTYTTNWKYGEYKIFTCYFDGNSSIQQDGKLVAISQLHRGDLIYSEGNVFDDTNRSCGELKLVKKK